MSGGGAPVGTEAVAQIVLLAPHDVGHPVHDLHRLLIRNRQVVAELGAGLQIFPQLRIVLKVGAAALDQRRGILRPVAQQAVDGYKGVRYHRQAVDQAAAGVVAGALMLRKGTGISDTAWEAPLAACAILAANHSTLS